MSDATTICNQALSWLGADPILSLTDETVNGDLCQVNYGPLLDATLESAAWTFATERLNLVEAAAAPAYGYSKKFLLPSEVLRVLECRNDPSTINGASNLNWRREGKYVVANVGVVYAKCVIRVTDTSLMSPLFIQAFTARIAATLSPVITESNTRTQELWTLYQSYISEAIPIDNMQGKSDRIRGTSLTSKVR